MVNENKNIYQIEITETLQKAVEIEADSTEEAITLARKEWKNGDILLDADDFVSVEFMPFHCEEREENEECLH